MKVLIYLICFFGFISGCSNENNLTEIVVDTGRIDSTRDISELIESISFIELKESSKNPLGTIHTMRANDGHYIFHDEFDSNKLFLYDDKGNFRQVIIKTGFNKADAANISDFWFNQQGNLEVYDYASGKLFRFDSYYRLINTIKADKPIFFTSIYPIPATDKYLGYSSYNEPNAPFDNKRFRIAIVDSSLRIISISDTFHEMLTKVTSLLYPQNFYPHQHIVRFIRAYDNYVYNVTETGITKAYKIKYTSRPLPEDINEYLKKNIASIENTPAIHHFPELRQCFRLHSSWLEDNKYFYFSSRGPDLQFYSIVLKENNSVLFNSKKLIESKKYKFILPYLQFKDEARNEFLAVLDGANLTTLFSSDSKYLNEIKRDPVVYYLIKVKFK